MIKSILEEILSFVSLGESLPDDVGEFFAWFNPYYKGVFIYLVAVLVLLKFSPSAKLIRAVNENAKSKPKESNTIQLLSIENRIKVYWFLLISMLFNGLFTVLSVLYFGGYSVEALLIRSEGFNNLKAFLILATLTAFMGWLMWLQYQYSNQIAGLIRTHNTSLKSTRKKRRVG